MPVDAVAAKGYGTYSFSTRGKSLELKLVSESCKDRDLRNRAILTSEPWTKSAETVGATLASRQHYRLPSMSPRGVTAPASTSRPEPEGSKMLRLVLVPRGEALPFSQG